MVRRNEQRVYEQRVYDFRELGLKKGEMRKRIWLRMHDFMGKGGREAEGGTVKLPGEAEKLRL